MMVSHISNKISQLSQMSDDKCPGGTECLIAGSDGEQAPYIVNG